MKRTNKWLKRVISLAAALTATAAMGISASACHFWFAQPKVPADLEKFRNRK